VCLQKGAKLLYIDCLYKELIIKRDIKFEFLKIKINRLKFSKYTHPLKEKR